MGTGAFSVTWRHFEAKPKPKPKPKRTAWPHLTGGFKPKKACGWCVTPTNDVMKEEGGRRATNDYTSQHSQIVHHPKKDGGMRNVLNHQSVIQPHLVLIFTIWIKAVPGLELLILCLASWFEVIDFWFWTHGSVAWFWALSTALSTAPKFRARIQTHWSCCLVSPPNKIRKNIQIYKNNNQCWQMLLSHLFLCHSHSNLVVLSFSWRSGGSGRRNLVLPTQPCSRWGKHFWPPRLFLKLFEADWNW